ncbi:Serine/Threonine kinase domain protein (macronuclear) [Tetrahymena thermophila SB210]|uniref:non-specific serine/threonine protein kinase n=1 Tax=Tetrahymena thermophila (strain SB210) TaxID=312017 RepID=Q23ED8_TETTS|nr:Serine/Threonine kinase domain protein [Tetrahymena thermophila SB210]EAR94919.1 Serine/Threonine kinase domain protein [Tetrahymena thermophila SB210]|eukprot:XP_001015164.1 Serine/Threonine kinase domain protein [Tetrahymena thermophila SB210]
MQNSQSQITDFEILKRLGEGSFGSVYQVKRKSDEKIYAMKKVKMMSLSTKEKENALNEVRILASIKSDNIISYKEAFYDEKSSTLCIIMEFATKGDVLQQISEKKKKHSYFEENLIWKYAADMLLGLKSLHDMKILHRDLKGANVFIAEDGSLKLGDLNVSKVQKRDFAYTQTGTPYYTSPEVWQNRPYDSKCDVWSLGCVLYEIVTLEPPFKGTSMEDLYKRVLRGNFSPINLQRYSSDLQKFIESCLKVEPKMRSSVESLLNHKCIMPHLKPEQIAMLEKKKKEKIDLLQTIKLPYGNNLKEINKRLPKSNYDILDEKIEEYEQEIKTDQIRLKKKNEDRPYSAVDPTSNLIKNNLAQKPSENPIQRPRDNSAHNNNNNNNNNYYNYSPQPNNRLQSAQPQVKRVLSNNDLGVINNPGKYYMPPIGNNQQKYNYHYYNQEKPYQPKIAIHQQKDSVYNNGGIQRYNSKEVLYKNAEQIVGRVRKSTDDLLENNRNYVNQRPPSNYYSNDNKGIPKPKLQPLNNIPKIPGSPQVNNNANLPPKPFRNY